MNATIRIGNHMTGPPTSPQQSVVVVGEDARRSSEISAGLSLRGWSSIVLDFEESMRQRNLLAPVVVLQTSSINPSSVQTLVRLREEGSEVAVVISDPQPTDGTLFLQIGAADYIPEPADLRELELRLRVVRKLTKGVTEPTKQQLHFNHMTVDLVERTLVRRDGERHRLSATECWLLRAFAERKAPLSRAEIRAQLSLGKARAGKSRVVDVVISTLRQKIDFDNEPSNIVAIRRTGYAFREPIIRGRAGRLPAV
jgi:two-component system OmpR family response regulator